MAGHARGSPGVGLVGVLALTACGSSPPSLRTPSVGGSSLPPADPGVAELTRQAEETYAKLFDAFVAASNRGADDTNWTFHLANGALADHTARGPERRTASGRSTVSARVDRVDDGWRVTDLSVRDVGNCGN